MSLTWELGLVGDRPDVALGGEFEQRGHGGRRFDTLSSGMVMRVASLGRQSEKRAAIEAAVLRATEELLTEGATFAELNIEKIATRAGISRTAFYFYFRDKRELLVRLTDRRQRAAHGRRRHVVVGRRRDPRGARATSPRSTASTPRCSARPSRSRRTTRRSPSSGAASSGGSSTRRASGSGRAGRRPRRPRPRAGDGLRARVDGRAVDVPAVRAVRDAATPATRWRRSSRDGLRDRSSAADRPTLPVAL